MYSNYDANCQCFVCPHVSGLGRIENTILEFFFQSCNFSDFTLYLYAKKLNDSVGILNMYLTDTDFYYQLGDDNEIE